MNPYASIPTFLIMYGVKNKLITSPTIKVTKLASKFKLNCFLLLIIHSNPLLLYFLNIIQIQDDIYEFRINIA